MRGPDTVRLISDKHTPMNAAYFRRAIYSTLVVMLWLGFVVDGTHALFTGQAALTGTGMTTGTANLLVSNSQNANSTLFDTTRPGFSLSLVPGQTIDKYFMLKNTSDGQIDFDISVLTSNLTGGTDIADYLKIGIYPVDDSGLVSDAGFQADLRSLKSTTATNLLVPHGTTRRFILRTSLDTNYSVQGVTASYDLTFIGVQHMPS
jgi:hypothetical protein